MHGGGMKEKILEKILEMLAQLPDSEDAAAPKEGVEVVEMEVKPMMGKDKEVC